MTYTAPHSTVWLRRHPSRERPRLHVIAFPHAGGTATFFHGWLAELPPDVELIGVQYPMREQRIADKGVESLRAGAHAIARDVLREVDGPIVLFGHSMGSIVAYEAALRLELAGRRPVCLVTSGRGAPAHRRKLTHHLLGDDELWAEVARLGGTSELILTQPELRATMLPPLRHDYRIAAEYIAEPDARLSCPLLALVGDADSEASVDEVRGWTTTTTGRCEVEVMVGGHFYLVPQRRQVVTRVLEFARECRSDAGNVVPLRRRPREEG